MACTASTSSSSTPRPTACSCRSRTWIASRSSLAPTTVLAQQHFHVFRERLANFPVTVEMLSRFVDDETQARTIEGLKAGQVDIVIGTHRLLQKDVRFKRLGLLVVDEEHRFGVM